MEFKKGVRKWAGNLKKLNLHTNREMRQYFNKVSPPRLFYEQKSERRNKETKQIDDEECRKAERAAVMERENERNE